MLAEPRRPDARFRGEHAPARPRWAAARGPSERADSKDDYAPVAGEARSFAPADPADGRLSGPD